MAADGRFGGHIVFGHFEGTGQIESMRREENAVWVTITCADKILDLIVEKGSICIDGISLTVAAVDETSFSVSLIPHTAAVTTLGKKRAGDTVNLETDIIGKYVRRQLPGSRDGANGDEKGAAASSAGITRDFLLGNGFF